mmetsp:Transcript_14943/g.21820  ORF Transcript_14943/g.21820 Transcript_14943/m.21820 type:complete len:86 (-) Transcript_14943:85-342(-)
MDDFLILMIRGGAVVALVGCWVKVVVPLEYVFEDDKSTKTEGGGGGKGTLKASFIKAEILTGHSSILLANNKQDNTADATFSRMT